MSARLASRARGQGGEPGRAEAEAWPRDGLERVERCPACGSRERVVLHGELTDRVFLAAPGTWTLHRCLSCGSAYLDPRPTPETLPLAYRGYFTHAGPGRAADDDLGRFRRFLRALGNGYRNRRFGGDLRPASSLGPLVIPLLPGRREVLDQQLLHLPRVRPGARLLDVGFGGGEFLELAASVGWRVAGSDPDDVAVENARARGLNVRQGGIEAFAEEPESFDVVTLSHVIEHVHDPGGTLRHAYRLLRPGGRLYLDTPNIDSLGHRAFGRHWRGLEVPRHLVIFTWPALEDQVRAAGFRAIRRRPRHGLYRLLAQDSRAVRDGRASRNGPVARVRDRLAGAVAGLRTRADYRNSEYVTLMACKPSGDSHERAEG